MLSKARLALNFDNDALAAHRDGIRLRLSIMGGLILLPFTLLHLINVDLLMLGVNAVLVVVMLGNAWALRRGRAPFVPFWTLGLVMAGGVCTSVVWQGVYGVFWAFPALFMLYFVLPRRLATVLALCQLLATTAACVVSLGLPTASRVFMSLGFVMVMINVVLNVIGELQQALVKQAITDPLTGAYNRRHLQAHLAQRMTPVGAAAGGDVLLAIDIDYFKQVNDRHGHAVGDEVLCRLVAAICARKRGSDLLFRTGGEEFVLLLPRTSLVAATTVAEELRRRLAEAELLPGETVTVSIGVAALFAGQTSDAWLRAADQALYEAKRAGRNRVTVDQTG